MLPSIRSLRTLCALLAVTALLVGASTSAFSDEPDSQKEVKRVRTILIEEDGEVVLEPADEATPRAEMHVIVQGTDEDGQSTRRVLQLEDGKWVAIDDDETVAVEIERSARPVPANPMASVLRWMIGESLDAHGRRGQDPLHAWFEGGENVPMAGLRDALKADGWTADALRAWLGRNLVGVMAEAPRPHVAPLPHRAHWFDVLRGPGACDCRQGARCGCDCHRPRCRDCGCPQARQGCRGGCDARRGCDHGWCGGGCNARRGCDGACGGAACRGDCEGAPARRCESCGRPGFGALPRPPSNVRAEGRAYVIWNDGSGWKHRVIQGPVVQSERRAPSPAPGGILRELLETPETADSARAVIEGLDLLPPDLMEQIPPEVLEGVMKDVRALGLGDLFGPAERGPGKGEPCGGDCKGACKDCPKAGAGSCDGDCDDCPKRKSDGGGCCGTCKGAAAK